jgi:hypothetical protein
MADNFNRFLGGPPLAVAAKLILLSILIGVVLSALGLDPWNIVTSVQRLLRDIWNMGFDAIRWLWQYFLLGAVLVIPIWLILRLVRAPKGR